MSDPTTPAAPAAPASPAAPAAPAIAWLPNADADAVGYVANKGWTSPADVFTGYQNLERVLGADRAGRTVVLPTGDDPKEWGQVYDRLGRPANPEGYQLPVPEGASPEFAKAVSAKLHELGIPQKAGQALAAWWNEQAGGATAAQQAAEQAKFEAETAQLAKDWGTGPDAVARKEIARRAMVEMGATEAQVDAIEKAVGYAGVFKMFAKVGDAMFKEHGAEGANVVGGFGTTPEGAKARKAQLMADADFRTKAMAPNSAQWAEIAKLDKIIAGAMQH
jgi:hypothetical protein